jgi:hypothetical protein
MIGSPLNRIGRFLAWLLSNALLAAVLYFAIGQDVEGAKRVAVFAIWLEVIASLFLLSNDVLQSLNKKSRPAVPSWVSMGVNMGVVFVLIWHGWVITGIAYCVHTILVQRRYESTISMADVFNEWVRRYSENPDEFSECLDATGKPFEDYGSNCEAYYQKIFKDMNKPDGLVQKPGPWPLHASANN